MNNEGITGLLIIGIFTAECNTTYKSTAILNAQQLWSKILVA